MSVDQTGDAVGGQEQEFIVALALGPVGSFIAGGRRSRDLWYGSRLLSEMTRQAVESLLQSGGTSLLIPDEGSLRDFWSQPHRGPVVTNKVLAKVGAVDSREVRQRLERARSDVLKFLADEIISLAGDDKWLSRIGVNKDALDAQGMAIAEEGDFVEFYGAWAPIGEGGDRTEAEKLAVKRARDVLLAGRKAARVFPAPTWTRSGRRKCSLDPGRDSVMDEIDPSDESLKAAERLIKRMGTGIRSDERLDAIGLLRRQAAFRESSLKSASLPKLPFPPLARVAADPWIEGADRLMRRDLADVTGVLEQLGDRGGDDNPLFLISSPCREPARKVAEVGPFPFDPTPLFENGIQVLARELDQKRLKALDAAAGQDPQNSRAQARRALRRLEAPVRRLHGQLGFPSPYYAMIEADGDDMGTILGRLVGQDRECAVTALGAFAKKAWNEVDGHHGFAFYVGGDELMAYLPVDKALPFVTAVSNLFRAEMTQADISSWAPQPPTLSAGVVIAHQKEDMRAVRGWASEALKKAKRLRRAAGSLEKAPDGEVTFREPPTGWMCVEERPAGGTARRTANRIETLREHMDQWRELIAGLGSDRDLSLATAHGLLEWAERFPPQTDGDTTGLDLAKASVCQRLKRRDKACEDSPWLKRLLVAREWKEVRRLANEILLADRIADVAAQRGRDRERMT